MTTLRELSVLGLVTEEALSLVLNRGLKRLKIDFKAKDTHFDYFFGLLQTRDKSLIYSNANHEIKLE